MRQTPLAIDITGIGMVTAVGHDAMTACAAIRAGLSRPAELAGSSSYDLAAAKKVPLTGHPVEPITNGFTGVARWLQLLPRAFHDLVRHAELPPARDRGFWSSTAVQLLLPDLEEVRFAHDERSRPATIHQHLLAPLLRQLPNTLAPERVLVQTVDRIGLALVLEGYAAMLGSLAAERVIVLAVDSYTCPFALDWLGSVGRLKSDLNPVGLMPGEAAAALLLEPSRRGSRRERPPWAQLIQVTTGQDGHIDDPDAAPRGRVLADVMRPLLSDDTGDVHHDLNGEVWRAREYGNALVELAPRGLGPAKLHHHASEIGDTGSVAFVVATALAARSLQRGYARRRDVAAFASCETGEIGGVLLRRHEGG